jgi:hypothetical protein
MPNAPDTIQQYRWTKPSDPRCAFSHGCAANVDRPDVVVQQNRLSSRLTHKPGSSFDYDPAEVPFTVAHSPPYRIPDDLCLAVLNEVKVI